MKVFAGSFKIPLLLALLTGECVRFNHEGQHRFHSLDGWRGRVLPQRSEKFPLPVSSTLSRNVCVSAFMTLSLYTRHLLMSKSIFIAELGGFMADEDRLFE